MLELKQFTNEIIIEYDGLLIVVRFSCRHLRKGRAAPALLAVGDSRPQGDKSRGRQPQEVLDRLSYAISSPLQYLDAA